MWLVRSNVAPLTRMVNKPSLRRRVPSGDEPQLGVSRVA